MKRMMLLTVVAFAVTVALGTAAEAQTLAMKPQFATVACKGNTAVCVKLELYQKIAAVGESIGSATARVQTGTATTGGSSHVAAPNPVTSRKTRAAGGVENNPADDSGGPAMSTVRKNADKQAKLMAKNNRNKPIAQKAAQVSRPAKAEAVRRQVMRRVDDSTDNNPMSSGRSLAPVRVQRGVERAHSPRERIVPVRNRAYFLIRAQQDSRARPTDF